MNASTARIVAMTLAAVLVWVLLGVLVLEPLPRTAGLALVAAQALVVAQTFVLWRYDFRRSQQDDTTPGPLASQPYRGVPK